MAQLVTAAPVVLSLRQRQIVQALWDGLSVKETATALGIRPMTVSQHLLQARAENGAPSTLHLIRRCVREGVLLP